MRRRRDKRSTAVWFWAGVIATLMGLAAWQAEWAAASGEPFLDEISVAQAKSKYDAGALILDVREPEEFALLGHIPGATWIPLGQLARRARELPRDKEIVVVCRSGDRSAVGRDILKKSGFKKVTNMAQGLNAWKAAGYPTVSGP